MLTRLLKRRCNVSLHRPVLDSEEQVATFYLWNLSGQLVGYQQYRPTAPKHHTEPKLAIPATLGVLSSTCTNLSRDKLFLQGCEIDTIRSIWEYCRSVEALHQQQVALDASRRLTNTDG